MRKVDLDQFLTMDFHIKHHSTGSPEEFAHKLQISRTTMFEYLNALKYDYGLQIHYDRYQRTYFYEGDDFSTALLKIVQGYV